MDLLEKIKAVEDEFRMLDREISAFQSWSGLGCKAGCGKCCFKADIEATVLEFLPFAQHLYAQDLAFAWLEKIKTTDSSLCSILNPLQGGVGMCSQYHHRGLICRLFGFSARTNKYGKKELVTCNIIREETSENFNAAVEKIDAGAEIPLMSNFSMRLHAIDFELTKEFFPINEAIKRAIEVILHYHAYRS
ncbi:MAG TPA: YkgJ family cysteine cluster protein [Chryseolinea sp.]